MSCSRTVYSPRVSCVVQRTSKRGVTSKQCQAAMVKRSAVSVAVVVVVHSCRVVVLLCTTYMKYIRSMYSIEVVFRQAGGHALGISVYHQDVRTRWRVRRQRSHTATSLVARSIRIYCIYDTMLQFK